MICVEVSQNCSTSAYDDCRVLTLDVSVSYSDVNVITMGDVPLSHNVYCIMLDDSRFS